MKVREGVKKDFPDTIPHIKDNESIVRKIKVRSFLGKSGQDMYKCTDFESDFINAIPLIELDTVFTPPFSLYPNR